MNKRNSFRLWGSYAGALTYTILFPLISKTIESRIATALSKALYFPFLIIFKLIPCNDWGCLGLFFVIYIILAPIIGFFVGYWIHRFFKK